MIIKEGDIVEVSYEVRHFGEEVPFDFTEDDKPLRFTIGSGEIIPGFEKSIIGRVVGDSIDVLVKPEDAYGDISSDLFIKMSKDRFEEDVYIGLEIMMDIEGREIPILIEDISDDFILVNANHPLAGCDLYFKINILGVER